MEPTRKGKDSWVNNVTTQEKAEPKKKKFQEVVFRKATVHDTGAAKELIQMFHDEHLNALGMNLSDILFKKVASSQVLGSTWVAQLPDEPIPGTEDFVHGKVVGIFSGYYTNYVLDNTKLFHELVWYVHPDYRSIGKRLYDHCENHIRMAGAKRMVMIHMATAQSEKIANLYVQMGFKPLETHYVKDL